MSNLKTLINRGYEPYCGQHFYHSDGRRFQYFPTDTGFIKTPNKPTEPFLYKELDLEQWFIHPVNNKTPKKFKVLRDIPFYRKGRIIFVSNVCNYDYTLDDLLKYSEFFEPIYE